MLSMVENCRESGPLMRRIIESTDNDETLLFEALSLYDELQQVLSKYEEVDLADLPPPNVEVVDDSVIASPRKGNPSDGKEEPETFASKKSEANPLDRKEGQKTLGSKKAESL